MDSRGTSRASTAGMGTPLDDLALLRAGDRSAVRRRPTRPSVLDLQCQAVREGDFQLISDRVVGVSSDGLVMETDQSVRPGETVVLSIRFAGSGRWVDAEAEVANVSNPEPGASAQLVALELGRIDGDSAAVLELLAALEAADSAFAQSP